MTHGSHHGLDAAQCRRGRLCLCLAGAGVGFAMALQMGLNANFLAEDIGISGLQIGILEAVRESCGIWAFLLLALCAGVSEPVLGAVVLGVVAIGLGGYSWAPGYASVMLLSVVWSQGLHMWMPLPSSMAMALAEPGRAGYRLGQLGAWGSAGFGAGLAAGYGLSLAGIPMRPMYILAAAVAVLAGVVCLGIPRQITTAGPRLVFRRRYGLYYGLSFLEGWRKQISICFAGFLLVTQYQTPLTTMLLLLGGVRLFGLAAAPQAGRLIDRIGERRILAFYFALLTLLFIGYAAIRVRWLLYTIFVLDNVTFVFVMALDTYVNRLAPAHERTATLSMGVAMNHLAAVAMPLAGGMLWSLVGYQWAFLLGAAAAAASVVPALRIRTPDRLPQPPLGVDVGTGAPQHTG